MKNYRVSAREHAFLCKMVQIIHHAAEHRGISDPAAFQADVKRLYVECGLGDAAEYEYYKDRALNNAHTYLETEA